MYQAEEPLERRGRETNRSQYPLKNPATSRLEGELKVFVQFHALDQLRASQAALERYVRTSFESQNRLENCGKVLSWLLESKGRPQKLRSSDYWRMIDESLGSVESFQDVLGGLNWSDDEVISWADDFDSALRAATNTVRGMRNPVQQGDPKNAMADLQRDVLRMRDVSIDIVKRCQREAGRVIDRMKTELDEIFLRIKVEQDFEEMARQNKRIEPSDIHAEREAETVVASPTDYPGQFRQTDDVAAQRSTQPRRGFAQ